MIEEVVEAPAADDTKLDPETLVLRGRPRPVVRFRRGLIVGISAVAIVGLMGVTWMALGPPSFRLVAQGPDAQPARRGPPDALAAAPATYADVPRLGPPLPGDLGRPILEQQRQDQAALPQVPAPQSPLPQPPVADLERERAAETERQRLAAAEQAARSSSVLVQLNGRTGAAAPNEAAAPSAAEQAQDLAGQASPAAQEGRRTVGALSFEAGEPSTHRLQAAPSPWTLAVGTIIPASLITGLSSDLPGLVLAQVTEPVRDTATGRTILIPQGARLIGRYDNVVAFGQRRALLVWQRIVLPDGSSVQLDNMPATDLAGYAGLEDRVDSHTWRLLKGIALSTLLGVGTELSLGSAESDLVRAVRESAQQNAGRAGDQITQRNLDIQPTLRVRPGWPVRAIVHKDLVLRPWRG